MGNDVFANGREISCKAADGKSIAAFPDVCMTPPENPATPPGVPVPYPNTGMAKDATSGSKNVKISRKEVMLKNKSYFKKSMGNEAGSAAKKGVVTSVNRGKVYFTSWSMDVKVEGENVVRHMDMTTHNHASEPPQTPPWMHVDKMAKSVRKKCSDEIDNAEKACIGKTPSKCGSACRKAQKCLLVAKGSDKESCCKPHTTGHHMIEDHWVTRVDGTARPGFGGYDYDAAPTVCANRFRKKGTVHRRLHDIQGTFEESYMEGGARFNPNKTSGGWNYGAGKKAAITAHQEVFHGSDCSAKCLEAQLDDYYGKDSSRSLASPSKQVIGSRRDDLAAKFSPNVFGK
jgi:hypothetical protein